MRSMLAIVIGLSLATAAVACPVAVSSYSSYVAPVVAVKTAVIPVATFVPVVVPLYGATYVAPAPVASPAPQVPNQQQSNDAILEAIKRISDRLDKIEQRQTMPTVPANPFEPAKQSRLSAEAKCLVCHAPGVAESKSGGVVLDNSSWVRGARSVASGRMPPERSGIVLTASERSEFLALLGR